MRNKTEILNDLVDKSGYDRLEAIREAELEVLIDIRDALVNLGPKFFDMNIDAPPSSVAFIGETKTTDQPSSEVHDKKKKGRPRKIGPKRPSPGLTPALWSDSCLEFYKAHTVAGEGYDDVIAALKVGCDTRYVHDYYLWKVFTEWFILPREHMTIKRLGELATQAWKTDPRPITEKPATLDITSIHHHVNKFMAIGLLRRIKKRGIYVYAFEPVVLKKGLDWFKNGNPYMRGNFQDNGFFKLT